MSEREASGGPSSGPSREPMVGLNPGEALTTAQAAAIAGIRPDTLRHYAAKGQAPTPRRFGGTLVWSEAEIRHWMQHRPGRGARTDLR